MKRFFLIPLMALMCSVMAWGSEITVSNFADLKTQLSASGTADVVKLANDIAYPTNGTDLLNILRSVTIDGQGHTISGYGARGSQKPTIAINYYASGTHSAAIEVTMKDLTIKNNASGGRPIEIRSKQADGYTLSALSLNNVTINATGGGNPSGIEVGGNQSSLIEFNIENSNIITTKSGYPIKTWNPIDLKANNSTFSGYCGINLQCPNSSAGTRGSVIDADACNFNSPNIHSGTTNAYAVFPMNDTGITFKLNNCGINGEHLGNQSQNIFLLSEHTPDNRRTGKIQIEITGDNSYINCNSAIVQNNYAWTCPGTSPQYGPGYAATIISPEAAVDIDVELVIKGGTYAVDPHDMIWSDHLYYEDADWTKEHADNVYATIPDGYEVKEITTQQGGLQTTLYRVRKTIVTSNSINDNVEGEGEGQNENTEFLISANETVEQESTIANYVEVSNNATLTVPSGKELEVTNGLDVTGGATLIVEAGSTIVVGEGGVTSENTESIVIEANENGSASFLLDPEVIINTTPNVTIKMTAKQVGYEKFGSDDYYYWFRFAAPVAGIVSVGKNPDRGTYFYKWDYSKNDWNSISALSELVPFQGYTLSTNHEGLEDVEYTFQGQLAGNQDMMLNFKSRGFNYFGNSYTGYIDVHALVDQLMANDNIDGTIYLWDNNGQRFYPVTLGDISSGAVEVTPMQTFILRQINTGEAVSTELNYASAIWGNPRYGKVPAPAPGAPARFAKASNVDRMDVVVTAANGKKDNITLKEADAYNADFEKGFDAIKFMNEHTVNLYATIDDEKYGIVATDNLEGMKLSFQTNNEIAYTLSFENVNSDAYAIRDNATGAVVAIEEGATYDFAAQPNSTAEGRFEIVNRYEVTTALENTEVKANAKGVYSITGQYLGEDFNALPAGVYVVNGVKIVK